MLDLQLLDILVCPVSKAPLKWDPASSELRCKASGLAYPVKEGIPVILEESARPLSDEEIHAL